MPKEQSKIRERQHTDLREPRRYKVTIYNDDFTEMDFEAVTLMMDVHKSGKAVVGIYSYDIALSKVQKAVAMARNEGFPLRLTCEPE